MEKLAYTPKEVKEILQIGTNKIYEILAEGRIKHIKEGRKIIIPRWALEEYLKGA